MWNGRHSNAKRRGFTLVELIVATAITTVILGSVVALFVFALRAVKSGNAAMDANEMTRAAFHLMERDLNNAFTSREHGEFFHFHGNEVGFSFIGLVRTFNATSGRQELQLGRVTYVINPIHESMVNGLDDDGNGLIDDDCDRYADVIYMERLDTGSNEMVEAQLVDINCATTAIPPGVLTVALLRYFEPGVESLDEYDPAVLQRIDNAIIEGFPGIALIEQEALNVLDSVENRDAQIIDEVRRIFRRDAYIRLLANARLIDPNRNSAFAAAPNVNDGWALLDPPRNQFDYVLADNILDIQSQKLLVNEDTSPYTPFDLQQFPYFLYGRLDTQNSGSTIEYRPTWNSYDNMFTDIAGGVIDGLPDGLLPTRDVNGEAQLGTPLEARLPEIVRVRLPFVFDSPYSGAPHLQRKLEQDIRIPTAFTRRNPLADNAI